MNTRESFSVHVVLHEPEIPPNTGNIARTCAALGVPLHLIQPLGFSLSDRYLKRAGLDYWEYLDLHVHDSFRAFLERERPELICAFTTKGHSSYDTVPLSSPLYLLYGPETRGLPESIRERADVSTFRIPMIDGLRSLNLSNAVAITLYDVVRRLDFPGLT